MVTISVLRGEFNNRVALSLTPVHMPYLELMWKQICIVPEPTLDIRVFVLVFFFVSMSVFFILSSHLHG